MAPRLSTLTSRRVFGSVPIVRYCMPVLLPRTANCGPRATVWLLECTRSQMVQTSGPRRRAPYGSGPPPAGRTSPRDATARRASVAVAARPLRAAAPARVELLQHLARDDRHGRDGADPARRAARGPHHTD